MAYNRETKELFLIFQRITNKLFAFANEHKVINTDSDHGIVDLGELTFLYHKDDNGFVPKPYKNTGRYWMSSVVWGEMQNGLQKHYLVKDGRFIDASGFYVSSSEDYLKFSGYHGLNSPKPYTSHNITLRIPNDDTRAAAVLRSFGIDNFDPGNTDFISIPTTPRDNKFLEINFIDEIIRESSPENVNSKEQQTALDARRMLELEYNCILEEKKAQLEHEILSEIEAQIQQEQEDRKQAVISGEVNKKISKKGKAKGKKSKAKSQRKKFTVQKVKTEDQSEKAKALYEKYKTDCFMKFRGVTSLLSSIAKDTETQRKFHRIINGSHINVHTDDGQGFTIVRPHGSKSEVPPSVVNRLINNAIQVFLSGE